LPARFLRIWSVLFSGVFGDRFSTMFFFLPNHSPPFSPTHENPLPAFSVSFNACPFLYPPAERIYAPSFPFRGHPQFRHPQERSFFFFFFFVSIDGMLPMVPCPVFFFRIISPWPMKVPAGALFPKIPNLLFPRSSNSLVVFLPLHFAPPPRGPFFCKVFVFVRNNLFWAYRLFPFSSPPSFSFFSANPRSPLSSSNAGSFFSEVNFPHCQPLFFFQRSGPCCTVRFFFVG